MTGCPNRLRPQIPVCTSFALCFVLSVPLIWRRVLVRSDTTIADLHATLQTAFGWTDEHLNRFVIHGREYGVSHDGGIGFRDDPRHVRLADPGLRARERFLYEYDFTDSWQHDLRIEQILPLEPGRHYPVCIGGRRALADGVVQVCVLSGCLLDRVLPEPEILLTQCRDLEMVAKQILGRQIGYILTLIYSPNELHFTEVPQRPTNIICL